MINLKKVCSYRKFKSCLKIKMFYFTDNLVVSCSNDMTTRQWRVVTDKRSSQLLETQSKLSKWSVKQVARILCHCHNRHIPKDEVQTGLFMFSHICSR